MELVFENQRLKALLESRKDMTKKFGPQVTKKLQVQLTQIQAVASFADLQVMPGGWHELKGDRSGQWACKLAGGMRLVIRATEQTPRRSDGSTDWGLATQAVVVDVVDYH